MFIVVLISAAIAPGLALLSYFYLRNEMSTEPRKTLLQAFIYGALITFPIMFIQYVMQEEHAITNEVISTVIVASTLEEFFKWLVIFVVILRHVDFDDPYDGILYGAAVSLGFASVENVLYLLAFGIDQALIRAILPVSSHALFGVVMGYYFGKGKFSRQMRAKELFALALFGPLGLHICYNAIFLLEGNFVYAMVPFMLFLWWFGLRKVKQAHEHLVRHLQENNRI